MLSAGELKLLLIFNPHLSQGGGVVEVANFMKW